MLRRESQHYPTSAPHRPEGRFRAAGVALALAILTGCGGEGADGGASEAALFPNESADAEGRPRTTSVSPSQVPAQSLPTQGTAVPTEPPAQPPLTDVQCPAPLLQGIVSCVAEVRADPERGQNVFLLDDLLACADAEPMAADRDAWCAGEPSDPRCGLDYEAFVEQVGSACFAVARGELFSSSCLLPIEYSELAVTPGLVVVRREQVALLGTPAEPALAEQIVWASRDMGFPVETAEAAIEATDDDAFELLELFDVGSKRTMVALTAHYGDTRVGRIFFLGTTTMVGAVEDGWITRCAVERLAEGAPCTATCADGLTCLGAVEGGSGVCVDTKPTPGTDKSCLSDADCERSEGLLCGPLGGGEGLCRSAWLRRSFQSSGTLPPGVTKVTIPIVASGLATVPTRVRLDLVVGQTKADAVRVSLENPSGTVSTVVDTTSSPTQDIVLTNLEVLTPGDESANGVWNLVVEAQTAPGGFVQLGMTVDSRFD